MKVIWGLFETSINSRRNFAKKKKKRDTLSLWKFHPGGNSKGIFPKCFRFSLENLTVMRRITSEKVDIRIWRMSNCVENRFFRWILNELSILQTLACGSMTDGVETVPHSGSINGLFSGDLRTCLISFSISPARMTNGPRTAYSILMTFGFIESNVMVRRCFDDVAMFLRCDCPDDRCTDGSIDDELFNEVLLLNWLLFRIAATGELLPPLRLRCKTEFKHRLVNMMLWIGWLYGDVKKGKRIYRRVCVPVWISAANC